MMMMLTPELVALTLRDVQDDGPEPGWTPLSETELDCLVDRIQGEAGVEPIWVFAYGSLIWNPEFNLTGRMRATAYGWHRFLAEDRTLASHQRAAGPNDGSGARCDGMVVRLSNENRRNDLRALVAREIKYREVADMVRWIHVHTPEGAMTALTFWASTRRSGLTKPLPTETTAALIAKACGQGGSCAQYLRNTIVDLEAEGIRDRNLWHLQALVAAEITAPQPS